MRDFEELLRDQGFASKEEFFTMTAAVDLTKSGAVVAFKRWQNEDGTKAGLERLQRGE